MKSPILIITLCFISYFSFSQDTIRRMKQLKVVVFHREEVSKGYVVSLNDSILRLVSAAASVNHPVPNAQYPSFNYNEINKMIVTRRGSILKGALIGAII